MLEDICIGEDANFYKFQEKSFNLLKAGDEMEKHYMVNYLKNEHNV